MAGQENDAKARSEAEASGIQHQYLFFVRHAESRWNEAQAAHDIVAMFKETDHGISENGRQQAEALRGRIASSVGIEDEWTSRLWKPGMIFVSPLTRAIETAVIALRDVLATGEGELIVIKSAREKKGVFGADTTGQAVGDEIKERVENQLENLYEVEEHFKLSRSASNSGKTSEYPKMQRTMSTSERLRKRETLLESVDHMNLDVHDVQERWWDQVAETEVEFHTRLHEFMHQVRSCNEEIVIVVGHSLFFQAVFRTFGHEHRETGPLVRTSAASAMRTRDLVETLKKQKIPNCGVVGLHVDWTDEVGPTIEAVELLFGTEIGCGGEDLRDVSHRLDCVVS